MSSEESGSLYQDQPQVVEPGTLAKYSRLFICSKIFKLNFIRLEKLSEEQITKEYKKYWDDGLKIKFWNELSERKMRDTSNCNS